MTFVTSVEAGDGVRCRMTKWGDRPHWVFRAVHLGTDTHGDWLGVPQGTLHSRPGFEFHSEVDSVTLVEPDRWRLSTFHAPGIWCDLYVDMTTPPRWDGSEVSAVDLDLDVIRMSATTPAHSDLAPQGLSAPPGEVFVDDEDEFADHQVRLGYPSDVVAAARASCDEVVADVRAGRAPYDGSHRRWLERLRAR